jgi:HopJ type III effector protein
MQNLADKIKSGENGISFQEVVDFIDTNFEFIPTKFTNGNIVNEAGQNSGSCKIFSFAKMVHLNQLETLQCFGDYYRIDVLNNPQGTDHQNIRNFMEFGWAGIYFENDALKMR